MDTRQGTVGRGEVDGEGGTERGGLRERPEVAGGQMPGSLTSFSDMGWGRRGLDTPKEHSDGTDGRTHRGREG